jgi:hypothetical protein
MIDHGLTLSVYFFGAAGGAEGTIGWGIEKIIDMESLPSLSNWTSRPSFQISVDVPSLLSAMASGIPHP